MNLLALQRRMARAVMTPLTPGENMRRKTADGRSMHRVAASFIKPNDRLTSFERLEIYNRQYWWRVLSAFGEDFPGVRAVLGDRRFEALAKAYISDCPSRSFTLRNLGSRLPEWLRRHSGFAGSRHALTLDMARLEWADIEAFDGAAEPALSAQDLAEANAARVRLRLQPYISLLALRYPVDDLLLNVRKEEDTAFASNAFVQRKKRKHVSAVARLRPAPIFLAVHRHDESVYFRRLDREEFEILQGLHHGETLGRAVEAAMRRSSMPLADRPEMVQHWFRAWASLGWFCRSAARRQAKKSSAA
ncbi:MAG TPA: DNA-binding domain-containing protein [Candidatus Acidoferrum sp.]|nr:DNA-binding domain-containing protein [Candidatus Acidoferrum sp.]